MKHWRSPRNNPTVSNAFRSAIPSRASTWIMTYYASPQKCDSLHSTFNSPREHVIALSHWHLWIYACDDTALQRYCYEWPLPVLLTLQIFNHSPALDIYYNFMRRPHYCELNGILVFFVVGRGIECNNTIETHNEY